VTAVAEELEKGDQGMKQAEEFFGRTRWTIQRYIDRGILPDRRQWTKAEFQEGLQKLSRRKRPGAADRLRASTKEQEDVARKRKDAPPSTETPAPPGTSAPPPAPPRKEVQPVGSEEPAQPPSPAPPSSSTEEQKAEPEKRAHGSIPRVTSCAGESDPHHVRFVPKAEKPGEKHEDEAAAPSSSGDGWENPFGDDWDMSQ
jgi:hypothetical protein